MVEYDGCVVGIVTEADLLHRAVVPDSADAEAKRSAPDRWPGSTVADLMSRDGDRGTPGRRLWRRQPD